MVAAGVGSAAKVSDVALEMACGPVSDSISTELTKSTLQAGTNRARESHGGQTGWGQSPQSHLAEAGADKFQASLEPMQLHTEMESD